MARIAYVDHSYHQHTLSTKFLPAIMRRRGHTVDFFWDEKWKGKKAISFDLVANYDIVIMFQCRCVGTESYFRKLHPNVIYIPMLDAFGTANGPWCNQTLCWEQFQGCKVVSFSTAVHGIATAFGIRSLPVKYYQDPVSCTLPADELRGFFWIRHEHSVSWPMVRTLLGETQFKHLHVHIAPDPGSPSPTLPSKEERDYYNITTSTWFKNKQDMLKVLEQANVFFAPRREEGIGQSFLEAMARGQCVVAPDNGTMNEYILHGLNGLLYDQEHMAPLDFTRYAELGRNAQLSVACGAARWHLQEQQIVDFILTPSAELYNGMYKHERLAQNTSIPCLLSFQLPLRKRIRQSCILRKTECYWLPVWWKIKHLL